MVAHLYVEKKTLIAKKTAAETVTYGFGANTIPATITIDGTLGAAETIAINSLGINDTDTNAVMSSLGIALELSATKNMIAVGSPCRLQFVKGITAAAVGLFIQY